MKNSERTPKLFDGGRSVPNGRVQGAGGRIGPCSLASSLRAPPCWQIPAVRRCCSHLADGRSRSAKRLALDAGVTPQTAARTQELVAAKMLTCMGKAARNISASREPMLRTRWRPCPESVAHTGFPRLRAICASRAAATTTSPSGSAWPSPTGSCGRQYGPARSGHRYRQAGQLTAPVIQVLHGLDGAACPTLPARWARRCCVATGMKAGFFRSRIRAS